MAVDPFAPLALLSAAVAALTTVVLALWRDNRRLGREVVAARDREVAIYKERDAQRDADAQTWRDALDHLEAIREAVGRRGR